MPDRITGPFDMWPFPIINAIIEITRIRNNNTEGQIDDIQFEVIRNEQGDV